jgi:uncharacterized membrane protein
MSFLNEVEKRYIKSLGLLSALCVAFFVYRVLLSSTWRYSFVFGNLILAWLGLVSGWLLAKHVSKNSWLGWRSICLTLLWLAFLPNTWYVGRNLRWNSWDVIANPGGVILSVSDRIVDPLGHPRALNITGLFFVLLSSVYFSIWTFVHPPKQVRK